MAISLQSLTAPKDRAVICTLVGEGGMGKTTLAAQFPAPVFIRTEDGTASLSGRDDVALFPLANSSQDVLDAMQALATEDHDFQTLVLDSITQLNTMIEQEIIASDPKNPRSINQALGGYGAGMSAVAERHRQIREAAGWLSGQKGINVVFIAHAVSETIDPPDNDSYTRYSIRMHNKSVSHYSDNVDLVGFIKLKTYTRGDGDKKKAISDGQRVLTCYPIATHISKNRFGIDADLPFDQNTNPLAPHIPVLSNATTNPATQA
jgi:hypothetical protein